MASCGWLAVPIATWTSSGNSGACSTTSSRVARPPARPSPWHGPRPDPGTVATFGDLWAAILPAALPVAPLTAAQLDREVGWVRVLKPRVPAFDALDPGD